MFKKLIMSCMALAAFAAFVLPATASATNNPDLTDAGGTRVAVGSTIIGTNIGETTLLNTEAKPILHCNNVKLEGKVLANAAGTVEGTISSANFQGTGAAFNGGNECTGSLGNSRVTVKTPMCVRSTPAMATDEFQVVSENAATCAASTGGVEFTIHSTIGVTCTYETLSSVKGDYTTGAKDELKVRSTPAGSGAKLTSGGFFCPSSGMLQMTFSMETANGETITIS
jgi:hypothetical protein